MRNGIKKIFIVSLFIIFGLCFNSSFTFADQTFSINTPTTMNDAQLSTFELKENANLRLNTTNKLFQREASRNEYMCLHTIFRNNTGIYLVQSTDVNGGGISTPIDKQGYFNKYCKTNYGDYCRTNYNYSFELDFITNEQYANPDAIFFYGDGWETLKFCFGYQTLNENICVESKYNSTYGGGLTGTLNLTYNPIANQLGTANDEVTQYTTNSPFGGVPSEENTTPQNNYYTCPTIQQLINTYPSQYNTGLCYSSNLIFSGGTIQTITPKSIFELYPYLTGFMRDIDLYNNYCTAPNTTTTCQTAFEGKEIEYTLISKAMDTNINKMKLYQYCHLQLEFEDKNATTCVSTGIYATGVQENITTQDIANALLNEDYQTILPATTGTVFEEIQGEERQVNWNILESIENIYTKITSIFQGRSGTEGIIPEYITRMILVICLFALFKK